MSVTDTEAEPETAAEGGQRATADQTTAAADMAETLSRAEETGPRDRRERTGNRAEAGAEKTGERVSSVTNNFYSSVAAEGAVFGMKNGGGRDSSGGVRVTGKLSAAHVAAVVERFARPACFDEAVDRLREDRVVVLEGKPGIGRRAGAVSLLREVTPGQLLVLSPALTLRDLAQRDYAEGYGYLVIDRMPDRATTDLDFTWSTVRDQICEAGAFLVVTCAAGGQAANKAVRHIRWERPSVRAVLCAQLTGAGWSADAATAVIDDIEASLPEEVSLAGLAALARLVEQGTDPYEALRTLDDNAAAEVRSWFADDPGYREIVEVTALCFLESTDVRTFEAALERLHLALAKRLPGKRAKAAAEPDGGAFGERGRRLNGLLDVKDVPRDVGSVRIVVFKDESYRRFILEELWKTRSSSFWDAVVVWLDELLTHGDSLAVASGLAWLACAGFEEVDHSYLQPWSWGVVSWAGQVTAVYVLWYMCHRDALAPLALQTAVGWANDRDGDRRWSAILAFSGELGLSFPTDAANRLWQLTAQTDDLRAAGCTALGCLFTNLNDDPDSDAWVVLALLDQKMQKFGIGPGSERMTAEDLRRMRELTMLAALSVLEITSVTTRRPAIIEYLHRHPERLDVIAGIWAGVIRYRPFRREAIVALRRGLRLLREISDTPREDARLVGAALSRALPGREHLPFKRDFLNVDRQLRRGQRDSSADVLLACLDAISLSLVGGAA
ncbi:hypothetical protein ACWEOZ_20255 [Actinoplanes sp. NPDC004185]